MPEPALKIGVIGAGRMGRLHAAHFLVHEHVESVVLIGRDSQRVKAALQSVSTGVQTQTGTCGPDRLGHRILGQAGTYADLDGLVLATSTSAHPSLLREIAGLGVPLLIEKPLAATVAEQQDLIHLLEEKQTPCMMGYHRRFDPAHERLRGRVLSGELGAPRGAVAVSLDFLDADESFIPGSGGLWRDLAVHDFNALAWVLGDEIVSVRAQAAAYNAMYERHGDADTGAALLSFASGVSATLICGRNMSSGQETRLEVHGTSGSAAAGGSPQSRTMSLEPEAVPIDKAARDSFTRFAQAYLRERDAFIDLIRTGKSTASPVRSCLDALRVAEAAEESVQTGREVWIDR